MRAYYFSKHDKKLRYDDGRQIRKGRTHKTKGTPVLCEHGLHASKRAIDALKYAPGGYLWVVDLGGEIVEGDDKVVATERKYIDGFDADKLLREFARKCALVNIEKIKPYTDKYDLIVEYLETGCDSLRSAASAACSASASAVNAAWSAAQSAKYSAADRAVIAAWSAAWSSANSLRIAADAARDKLNELLEDMISEVVK